eukprot:CAMPEP_0184857800 /NCGR_PEP_ID=MMETSP0580-20130426/2950_1 /TAXON_ID=1118495 /ORGANISM="Dactyliosolen fragilissimus" /LENGTH=524 /DNA_ID=CAMNT_0027353615 /DNA_START=144 /DNA_END=1718 /DNA_ORIENTATION=-
MISTASAFVNRSIVTSKNFSVRRGIADQAFRYWKLHRSFSVSYSTTSFSNLEKEDEDDLDKWEKMYKENTALNQLGKISHTNATPDTIAFDENGDIISEVRVVTFDLDNTLWKTSAVITSANDALASYLQSMNIYVPTRVEVVMGELFRQRKEIYSPSLHDWNSSSNDDNANTNDTANNNTVQSKSSSPVYLTQLRKDAIKDILVTHNGYDENDEGGITFANQAFEVWANARHSAIPLNFADSVLSCLTDIRNIKTSHGHNVIIGAITDGNSDPRKVNILKPFFDFCVNAEGVGVSKPNRKVYDTAILHVASREELKDIFDECNDWKDSQLTDNIVGSWWVHVGDDFMKDIVAAKEMKMRSIWSRELILKKPNIPNNPDINHTNNSMNIDTQQKQYDIPQREVFDLMKEIAEKQVIQMSIGSEDFLANTIEMEFADAIVDEFKDVASTIINWHNTALTKSYTLEQKSEIINPYDQAGNDNIVGSIPLNDKSQTRDEITNSKFCIHCGTKLPLVAKFCSSCGGSQ